MVGGVTFFAVVEWSGVECGGTSITTVGVCSSGVIIFTTVEWSGVMWSRTKCGVEWSGVELNTVM